MSGGTIYLNLSGKHGGYDKSGQVAYLRNKSLRERPLIEESGENMKMRMGPMLMVSEQTRKIGYVATEKSREVQCQGISEQATSLNR